MKMGIALALCTAGLLAYAASSQGAPMLAADNGPAIPRSALRAPGAHLGISKQMIYAGQSAGSPLVKVRFHVRNYGDQVVSNITIDEDLNAVYGAGNFVHVTDPIQFGGEGSLNYNSSFDGSANTGLLAAGSTLAPGEFVMFEIASRVTTLSDQGFGFGDYRNQVTVLGTDPGANVISDISTEGPDPDPDGNDAPGDNSVVSQINLASLSAIGTAQTAAVAGTMVTIDIYIEAFGTTPLSALSLTENLDGVFGAGNYLISAVPALVTDPGTVTINAGFNGSADAQLLAAGSSLAAGAIAQIRFSVEVVNIVNRGFGLGNFRSQSTVLGQLANGVSVSDQSNTGTDPDPNGDGNPSGAGEATPTTFTISLDAITGLAKAAAVAGTQVTFDFYLRNYGTAASTELSLVDNLDAVFGAGNYLLGGAPVLIDDPGSLVLNTGFNGSGQTNVLGPASSLAPGDTAQVRVVVNVTTLSDPQGLGLGIYRNQASITGLDSAGLSFTDLSDEGSNPDSGGDNDPTGLNEDTPTLIAVGGQGLGAALQTYVGGTVITMDYLIENKGASPVSGVSVVSQLLSVFGFGNFSKLSGPTFIENPGTVSLNNSFDGLFSPTLVSTGSLPGYSRARIRVVFNVTNVTNQGNGFGVYPIGFTVNGTNAVGSAVSDVSDAGVLTDANGNGFAGDPGEDDLMLSVIGEEAVLGAAMQGNLTGNIVDYDLYLENLGNVDVQAVSLIDNLDAVFGAGNYSISALPLWIDDPGTLTLNAGFDGSSSSDLLAGGFLAPGDTAQLRFSVTITAPGNVGLGFGVYANQAIASGQAAAGSLAADLSDDGSDPDPNGTGNPADAGESDPTVVMFSAPVIGVAKQVSADGELTRFDFVIENLGSELLTEVSLLDNLDGVFGAGNYQVVGAPSLISPPRNLTPNPGFNGAGNTQLIAPGSSIAAGVAEQVRVGVRVLTLTDQGMGIGVHSNQASASTAQGVTDLSGPGSDPDPNGNGNPDDAGENAATVFTVATADLAIDIDDGNVSASPGSSISYTTTLSNNGSIAASNVAVTSGFAAALSGCSTTSVAAGGASGNEPGPLAGNINDSGISVPVAASVIYTTTCTIPSEAAGTQLVSSAAVTSTTLDPDAANNSASDTTAVALEVVFADSFE